MTQSLADDLRMHAYAQHQSGADMAKIVETERPNYGVSDEPQPFTPSRSAATTTPTPRALRLANAAWPVPSTVS
jgi:hypothetical protein